MVNVKRFKKMLALYAPYLHAQVFITYVQKVSIFLLFGLAWLVSLLSLLVVLLAEVLLLSRSVAE
jgi:hypothetical protein